jgi:hypothetical protein
MESKRILPFIRDTKGTVSRGGVEVEKYSPTPSQQLENLLFVDPHPNTASIITSADMFHMLSRNTYNECEFALWKFYLKGFFGLAMVKLINAT